jgi:hypothetical protein
LIAATLRALWQKDDADRGKWPATLNTHARPNHPLQRSLTRRSDVPRIFSMAERFGVDVHSAETE